MRLRRKPRAFWAHPDTDTISKFLPRNPPTRGDHILVNGERCVVLACPVKWDDRQWTMTRGVKVRPAPRSGSEPCPTCGCHTMRGSRGVNEDFVVCANPVHGPVPEHYVGRTFGP